VSDFCFLIGRNVIDRRNVLAWNDKYMRGSLRANVPKGDRTIVFVHDLGLELFCGYFTE
jgi:hypothetical protein